MTFTASDECGLTSSTSFTFTITDTTVPTLIGGANGSAECTGTNPSLNAAYIAWRNSFGGVTTTDACGNSTMSYSEGTWTALNACTDQITVTFTATDECLNTSTTTAVFKIEDTTPPVIVNTAKADLTVECAADWTATLAAWLVNNAGATATYLCGSVTWSNNYNAANLSDLCGATGQVTG